MRTYLIRRLLLLIPTLFIVTVIVFLMVRLIPGTVVDVLLAELTTPGSGGTQGATPPDREELMRKMGLDVPIHIQYGHWISDIILHWDFGDSLRTRRAVTEVIAPKIPVTVELGAMALVLAMLISLPLGVYSAIRQDTAGDYIGRSIAIGLIAIPGFWIATMVMVFPSIWWHWTPSTEYIPLTRDPWGNIRMLIIPALIMGTQMAGSTMRMTRTMMLEVLRQDYIRTAWSKGLSERVVVIRHALKNAFIPVVTIVGLQLPVLLGGAVIIEQIFNLPGMGRLMLEVINRRDYTVVSGINLLIAAFVLVVNVVVDISYGFLDPRVRYK
jgi:peptide/nickel transport system permease protein